MRRQLLDPSGAGFFLVPLQLSTDSQLLYASPRRSNVAFISHVIRSFSRHANDTDLLVFKHHPMERGHADYAADIDRLARQ
ncbi:capsular polysaccharide export protein, LipB/KpsS family [Cupriavidus basilensis]